MDEAPVGITVTDPSREDNPLIYVNEAFERVTGYSREEAVGRNCRFLQGEASDPDAVAELRAAVEAGERTSVELVNYRANGAPFWNEVSIAPLRDDAGRVTHFVGFQDDVTARKEAELAAEREREALEHLLTRIRGLVGDVMHELAEAEGRNDIEQGVVRRIADADGYALAWVGELDGERVVPRAWAGALDGAPETLAVDRDADHPTARAARTRALTVGSVADHAAVPLVDGETLHGVLTVYAARPDGLDEHETSVLDALGRAIGTALSAVARRRVLSTSNHVELEFSVDDSSLFFVALSERCGCRLDYEGSVLGVDDARSMFFRSDTAPTDLLGHAAEIPGVERATHVSEGADGHLFEFVLAADSFVVELAGRGVRTRGITARDGTAWIRLELPADTDPRAVTDRFRARYAGVQLLARREHERPPTTRGEFIDSLDSRLTRRQSTALRKAYLSGFYDPTRSTTGDELAASMGISRSTFHQHLRAAERKVIGEFLDG